MSEHSTSKHHKSDKYTSIILSIIAIVVAAIALAVSSPRDAGKICCRKFDLGFDYLGIIIGLLALMVTLLVAWNIWQTIEAKRSIEKFEEKTNNYNDDLEAKVNAIKEDWNKKIEDIQNKTKSDVAETESYIRGFVASDVYHKLHHLHYIIYNRKQEDSISPFDDILYNFLFHSIKGLWHKIGDNLDIAYCKATLTSMINLLEHFPEDSLSETQKATIYAELEKIEPKLKSLRTYNEFMKKIKEKEPPF